MEKILQQIKEGNFPAAYADLISVEEFVKKAYDLFNYDKFDLKLYSFIQYALHKEENIEWHLLAVFMWMIVYPEYGEAEYMARAHLMSAFEIDPTNKEVLEGILLMTEHPDYSELVAVYDINQIAERYLGIENMRTAASEIANKLIRSED